MPSESFGWFSSQIQSNRSGQTSASRGFSDECSTTGTPGCIRARILWKETSSLLWWWTGSALGIKTWAERFWNSIWLIQRERISLPWPSPAPLLWEWIRCLKCPIHSWTGSNSWFDSGILIPLTSGRIWRPAECCCLIVPSWFYLFFQKCPRKVAHSKSSRYEASVKSNFRLTVFWAVGEWAYSGPCRNRWVCRECSISRFKPSLGSTLTWRKLPDRNGFRAWKWKTLAISADPTLRAKKWWVWMSFRCEIKNRYTKRGCWRSSFRTGISLSLRFETMTAPLSGIPRSRGESPPVKKKDFQPAFAS